MKRLILSAVVLLLAVMALSPVVTLAADPPGMEVEIVVIGDDVVVYVNGDQLANQADIANAMGKLTGSGADLWMWNTVHNLDDFAQATGTNMRILMDAQAKTILLNQVQQSDIESLGSRIVDLNTANWNIKMATIDNGSNIKSLNSRLDQTDALLLATTGDADELYQWAMANNNYWSARVATLESQVTEFRNYKAEQEERNRYVMYGGAGIALCFFVAVPVAARRRR